MECTLCPLRCGADKTLKAGACGVMGITVAKYYLHPYEEPPICYKNGSGAIFFGGCSLKCVFCQNYEVSRAKRGKKVTPDELCEIFRGLEEAGADCLDLVTCDHVADEVAKALKMYKPHIPVVLNTSGYITQEALELLNPFIDVYLPDLKFCDEALCKRYTRRGDYFKVASEAIRFMAKKPLVRGERGELLSGILVRHLVLPSCTYDSLKILDFLKETLPSGAPISIMRQYTPMGDVENFPELQRRVTAREYRRVCDYAYALGFSEVYTQGKESATTEYVPKWDF